LWIISNNLSGTVDKYCAGIPEMVPYSKHFLFDVPTGQDFAFDAVTIRKINDISIPS
jgi:hypothetical protein